MRLLIAAVSALVVALALLVPAPPAAACGGFFCSQIPVEQTGERIVFGVGSGTVTATIQINYMGPAEEFAWVVPVSSAPELSLGTDSMFSILNSYTAPQYYLNWQFGDGTCGIWPPMADGATGGGAGGGDGGGEVVVLEQDQIGPYDFAVVSSSDATALMEWLEDNDYDQPEESAKIIAHYVEQEMVFLAMKLTKDADTGDLQPITLSFDATEPCVPLVLTRIAAMPDMPVLVWVFSEDRAVPSNWFEVELNEAKIDWFSNAANYDEVVSAAVDEAAGHAFVTEYAQDVDPTGWFYTEGQWDTTQLAQYGNPAQFLDEALWMGLPRDAQMQALIRKYIPQPQELPEECQDESAFYNWNKEYCFSLMPEGWSFDAVGFAEEIEARVVEPLRQAQVMADHFDYLTRMYTTVSAEEMTRDPMFAFNPDLPTVSNFHTADAMGICSEDGNEIEEVHITLDSGETFVVEGPIDIWGWGWGGPGGGGDGADDYDYTDPVPDQPAAATIHIHGTSGPPEVVAPEDVEEKEQSFALMDPTTLPWDGELPDDGGGPDDNTDNTDNTDDPGPDDTPDDSTDTTDDPGTGTGTDDGSGAGTGGDDGTGSGTDDGSGGDGGASGGGTTGGDPVVDDGTVTDGDDDGATGGDGTPITAVGPGGDDSGCAGGTAPLGNLALLTLALAWIGRRRLLSVTR